MNHFGLIKNCTSNGAIEKRRIVGFGAVEGEAVQATGDQPYLGVTGPRGAEAAGSRVDVQMDGLRDLDFGGVIAYGDWITADANGKGIVADPAADAQMNVIGRAMESGVDGSYGKVQIIPQQITG